MAAAVQAAPRVLVVVDRPDDPFAERIRAELLGLGLGVLTLETWHTGEPVTALDATARREQAAAAVRMIPSRRGVEIWLGDQSTGRPLLRQLVVDERPEGPNQGLVVLQTVELLRMSLLPSSLPFGPKAPGPPAGVAGTAAPGPPVIAAPAGPPPPAPEVGVQVALGALFSPGGAGAALQAWSTLHRALSDRLDLALDVSLPLRSATITAAEGSARFSTYLLGLALAARAARPSQRLHAGAALGASVLRVGVDGDAVATLVSRSTSVVTGAAYGRADGGVDATSWLRIGLRGVAGVAASRVDVRFAGNDAGSWGRAFFAAFVTVDVAWR